MSSNPTCCHLLWGRHLKVRGGLRLRGEESSNPGKAGSQAPDNEVQTQKYQGAVEFGFQSGLSWCNSPTLAQDLLGLQVSSIITFFSSIQGCSELLGVPRTH